MSQAPSDHHRHQAKRPLFAATRRHAVALASLVATVVAPVGWAQDYRPLTEMVNEVTLRDSAFTSASGVVGINQAAGDLNAQANIRAIAAGSEAGAARAEVHQRVEAGPSRYLGSATGTIEDQAFTSATGLISINQSSGIGNAAINSIAIGPSAAIDLLSDEALSGANPRALTPQQHTPAAGQRRLTVENTAFAGARGVLQINQSAGVSNITRNRVVMQTGR